jgi:hypothetical protein
VPGTPLSHRGAVTFTYPSPGGFFLARRLPVWASVALVVQIEVGVALMIRDNLTLNIVMLLHPFEFIRIRTGSRGDDSPARAVILM